MTVTVTRMLYLNPDILPPAVKSLGIGLVMFAGKFLDVDGEKGKDFELLCFFCISLVAVVVITYATLRIFGFAYSVHDPRQERISDS